MISIQPPTAEELIQRTAAIAPALRSRAAETEALRRIPDENIQLLKDAGLFKLYQPARLGGYELPYGNLQVEISALVGAACGSTAWVQTGMSVHAWMIAGFAREAQDAVWGDTPEALVATAVSPLDGRARAVAGGIVLDGTWQFSSGCQAADWIVIRATPASDGAPKPTWCLLPMHAVEIVDVWHASGLRGTGSHDVRIRELFVPDAFTLDFYALRGSATGLYGLPFMGVFQLAIAAPMLGLAKGALADFCAATLARPELASQTSRQLRYAQSVAEVDAAELILKRIASDFESAILERRNIPTADRLRFKRDASFVTVLCRNAVDRLVQVIGAHGLADGNPIQRAFRDCVAISSHYGLAWDISGAMFGGYAFGLTPSDPMALVEDA